MASTSGPYSYVPFDGPPTRTVPRKKRNAPRNTLPERELIALRQRDAQRKRTRRQNMSEEERRKERERDKQRKARKRKETKGKQRLPGVTHLLNSIPLPLEDMNGCGNMNHIPKLPKPPPL